jgi:hypothetical protein
LTETPSASEAVQKPDGTDTPETEESYKSDADYLQMCAHLGIEPSEADYQHHLVCQEFARRWEEENGCTVGSDILRYWGALDKFLKRRAEGVNNAS